MWGKAALALLLLSLLPVALASASQDPLVCVYFYVWYSDGRHWGEPGHPYWSVVDVPVRGYYDSRYASTIAWQLGLISGAGVDCLFVSWWGPGSFEDEAARLVFERLGDYGLKAALLIEPYLGQDPALYNQSWWGQTLAYLRDNFIEKYPAVYLSLEGKPLVLAFNPIGLGYDPSADFPGYAIRIVGNDIDNAGYQDWDLWPDYDAGLTGELRARRDGYVAIAPRFDDEHFRPGGVPQYDPDLTRGWYQRQWQWVLGNLDKVRIVAIYSWNEYHERSHIEPANNREGRSPYHLYNLTTRYIGEVKEPGASGRSLSPEAVIALGLALAALAAALARLKAAASKR